MAAMLRLLRRAWSFVAIRFRRPEADVSVVVPTSASIPPTPALEPELPPTVIAWNFRRFILDRLEEYFYCIHRIRALDSDAYEYFSRVGFMVPPADGEDVPAFCSSPLGGAETWPSLVGLAYAPPPRDRQAQEVYPSFIYAQRLKRPVGVEPVKVAWRLTAVFDNRQKRGATWRGKLLHVVRWHLSADGTRVLRERSFHRHRVTRDIVLRDPRWSVSIDLHAWFDEHAGQFADITAFGTYWLRFIVGSVSEYRKATLVRVCKRDDVATFAIPLKRAPYFFRDRTPEFNDRGTKRRIFHSVVRHERTLVGGRRTTVCSHYRGSRSFEWQGYGVRIVKPTYNRDAEFLFPASERLRSESAVTMGHLGEVIAGLEARD